MNNTKTKKRTYRRITPKTVAAFKIAQVTEGNNTAAVETIEPDRKSPKDRAYVIAKKSDISNAPEYIDTALQQIGIKAVDRLNELVLSEDEAIATRNVHYAIDHIRGQATKKSISVTGKFNIQNVLD